MIARGPSSSVSTMPLTPAFSPSQPSSPSLRAVTPPTPAHTPGPLEAFPTPALSTLKRPLPFSEQGPTTATAKQGSSPKISTTTPYMIARGPSSSVSTTPLTPAFSPSQPYSTSPILRAVAPPPAHTLGPPEAFLTLALSTPVSPYLLQLQQPSWPMSKPVRCCVISACVNLTSLLQEKPFPELERPLPFSEHRRGPMVPQKRYKPHTSSDRRRYVNEVHLEPSIHFFMQKPDEERIPLRDAMHGRLARLIQRDEPMFQERGPSISVRINVSLTPHSIAVGHICKCITGPDVLQH
jgi:hypothetical protein